MDFSEASRNFAYTNRNFIVTFVRLHSTGMQTTLEISSALSLMLLNYEVLFQLAIIYSLLKPSLKFAAWEDLPP